MNYSNDSQQKNVFTQISEGWRSFWSAFKGASDDVKGTWYDDAARVIKPVLFFASVTTGVSYAFSNHIFFGWLGEFAWYPAILLAIVLELAMVFVGFIFFHGIAKKQTWYQLPAVAVVFALGIVFFFACRWGYRLSSDGQGQLAIMYAQKQAATDTTFVNTAQNPRLAGINAQIEKIDNSIEQQSGALNNAYSIKWRKKVTEQGQKLASQANNNLAQLETTKAALIAEKMKIESSQDSTQTAQRGFNVSTQSEWSNLFGGYMEIFKIGCIAALAFCAVGVESKKGEDDETATTLPSQGVKGQMMQKKIGFAYGSNKPQAVSNIGVTTELQPVTTDETIKKHVVFLSDKIKTETGLIQAWVGKIRNKQGNLETNERNILTKLEAVNAAMSEYFSLIEKKTTA